MAREDGWAQGYRWLLVLTLVALAGVGVAVYRYNQPDDAALAKADQLASSLHAAGLPVPQSRQSVARMLGTDGGSVCADPGSALRKALQDAQLSNGAANVGQRPIRAEVNLIRGTVIVLQVYCPERVQEYRDRIQDYVLDHVSKD